MMWNIDALPKLRQLMKNDGVCNVAKLFDVTEETLRRYLRGKRRPRDVTKVRMEQSTNGYIKVIDWFPRNICK